MERDKLLKQYNDLSTQRRKLKIQLNIYLEDWIKDAIFYTKNPMELKKKYSNVLDYMEQQLKPYHERKKFQNEEDMLNFLKLERKNIHTKLKQLKQEIKNIKDTLSNIPK